MIALARLSIGKPKLSLAVWATAVLVLALIGFGVAKSLAPTIVVVPGSESSRAQQLAEANFGPTQLVPILLRGPASELDKQGPKLVKDLLKRPHLRALTAWDAGSAASELRPSPTAAMIVLSVDKPERDVVNYDQPAIEALVAKDVSKPVQASVTGQPSIDRALKDEAISTTRRSELIALGVLFLLLLLGLRSLLASIAVALVGAATVLGSFGLMALAGKLIDVDPLALALASMTGLALGVGYSLLILDRFHQEEALSGAGGPGDAADPQARHRQAVAAATEVTRTTGKAVMFAGTGLILALALASAIAPTKILVSLGVGVLLCSLLAVGGAVVVVPAALSLFGERIAGPSIGAPAALQRDWDRLVGAGAWVRRNAAITGLLATGALLLLAVPTLALKTGPPDVSQLPKGNKARAAFEAVASSMGPGWPTPYNMIVVSHKGPLTTAKTLQALDRFQERLAKDPAVKSVAGPGALSSQTKPLGKLPGALAESGKLLTGGKRDLGRLSSGLGQAGTGAKQLQGGLAEASSGAGLLYGGAGEAQTGSAKLHAGLAAARSGSAKLSAGLEQALSGANALKSGATQALAGSIDLANGLGTAKVPVSTNLPSVKKLASVSEGTSGALAGLQGEAQHVAAETASALAALKDMTSGKGDPRYGEALAALERANGAAGGVWSGVSSAAGGASEAAKLAAALSTQEQFLNTVLSSLSTGASKLQKGLGELRTGNAKLAAGIGQLSGGGGQLTSGLTQLRDGAGALEAGLGKLTSGAGQLQAGLAGGVSPTGQLVNGLGQLQAGVAKFRTQLPSPKDLETLQQQSPGLFNSGYFLLAAVQGAQPGAANEASFAVNVGRGGDSGQILIVSRYPPSDGRTASLGERLTRQAKGFAAQNHLEAAVGGPAGNLADYTSETNERLPWVIVALAVAVAAVLAVALRALLLPVVAVAMLLLTAAATFGVMQLLFGGSHPPLGGPGYLDPMSITGIFTVVFGVSLVYLVVLLARAREQLLGGASVEEALDVALRKTAAASTGSGLLMIATLIPFATSDLATVQAFGIAVAVAIALDAFLVRPVLLPATVAVLGRASWWPTNVKPSASPPKGRQAWRTLRNVPLVSRLRHHHP